MGIGSAPTWLRQVSPPPPPLLHMTTLTTGFTAQPLTVWRCVCERRQTIWPGCTASSQCLMGQCSALLSQWRHQLSAMTMKSASASGPDCAPMSHTRGDADRIRHVLTSEPTPTRRTSNTTLILYRLKHLTQFIHFLQGTVCSVTIFFDHIRSHSLFYLFYMMSVAQAGLFTGLLLLLLLQQQQTNKQQLLLLSSVLFNWSISTWDIILTGRQTDRQTEKETEVNG